MKPQTSLRNKLLRLLLPAMLMMMVASAVIAYSIAFRSASHAYDRALLDTSLALAGQIHREGRRLTLSLSKEAEEILLTDKFDETFFRVLNADGSEMAGDARLATPTQEIPLNSWRYYDSQVEGKPLRVAALRTERDGLPVTVLSAETLIKRNNLMREIVIGMLLPELVLAGVTLALIWFGIRSGLRPLEELRQQLAKRSQNDLRPIVAHNLADEIQPLIGELNHLLRQLDDSLQRQRHFVSDAAHQLRTPIAALQAQLEVMLRDPAGPQRAQITYILSAVQRLVHLVHQLLTLARAEPIDQASPQRVDLPTLIRNLADTRLTPALAAGLDLGFDINPAAVEGSALLLQEAVGNLIDNAIRYTPAPGSITVGCRSGENGAVLYVEDSGPGIPQALRSQVFERFYRVPGSQGDGCGLGLAIVAQIARQHGATVSIETSPELGGAAVAIRFPAPADASPGDQA